MIVSVIPGCPLPHGNTSGSKQFTSLASISQSLASGQECWSAGAKESVINIFENTPNCLDGDLLLAAGVRQAGGCDDDVLHRAG